MTVSLTLPVWLVFLIVILFGIPLLISSLVAGAYLFDEWWIARKHRKRGNQPSALD